MGVCVEGMEGAGLDATMENTQTLKTRSSVFIILWSAADQGELDDIFNNNKKSNKLLDLTIGYEWEIKFLILLHS